jgi:hypothetical protein
MLLKGRHPVRTVDIMLTCIAESVDRFNADIAKLLVSANEAAANTKPRLPVRGPRLLMPDHPRGSSMRAGVPAFGAQPADSPQPPLLADCARQNWAASTPDKSMPDRW